MQRPWGSAFPHILGSTLSAFLTHFTATVSTEAWQYRPHRLITFRLDVLLGGTCAAFWHLDNILEFDMGFKIYEQVHPFTACELHARFCQADQTVILLQGPLSVRQDEDDFMNHFASSQQRSQHHRTISWVYIHIEVPDLFRTQWQGVFVRRGAVADARLGLA